MRDTTPSVSFSDGENRPSRGFQAAQRPRLRLAKSAGKINETREIEHDADRSERFTRVVNVEMRCQVRNPFANFRLMLRIQNHRSLIKREASPPTWNRFPPEVSKLLLPRKVSQPCRRPVRIYEIGGVAAHVTSGVAVASATCERRTAVPDATRRSMLLPPPLISE